jgi:hypothetical protein
MAQQVIRGGAYLDIPDIAEISATVGEQVQHHLAAEREMTEAVQRDQARAVKWLRLPVVLQGFGANSALALTVGAGFNLGPDQGYAWSIRRLAVSGLTAGATPDVVNLNLNAAKPLLWQFTGTATCAAFGKLSLVLQPGDRLELSSVGTFASTSLVTLAGELVEVPAEMLWKLI